MYLQRVRYLVLFLFILSTAFSAHASITNDSIVFISAIKKAPYLFEGTLVKYETINMNGICKANCLIRLHKVFKGNIRGSYVMLFTYAPSYICEKVPPYISDYGDMIAVSDTGKIFFFAADTSFYESSPPTDFKAFNCTLFCRYNSFSGFFYKYTPFFVTDLGNKKFYSLYAFYTYVQHLPGAKRRDIDSVQFHAFPTESFYYALSAFYVDAQNAANKDSASIKSLIHIHDFVLKSVKEDGFGIHDLDENKFFKSRDYKNFETIIKNIDNETQTFNGFRYLAEIQPLFEFSTLSKYEYSNLLNEMALSHPEKVEQYLLTLNKRDRRKAISNAGWAGTNAQTKKDFLKHIGNPLRRQIAPVVLKAK